VGSILHFTDIYVNLHLYETGKWIEACMDHSDLLADKVQAWMCTYLLRHVG
jgi:hypothetical protein